MFMGISQKKEKKSSFKKCYICILILFYEIDTGSYYVARAGLELLASSSPPALAFRSAGTTMPDRVNFQLYLINQVAPFTELAVAKNEFGVHALPFTFSLSPLKPPSFQLLSSNAD